MLKFPYQPGGTMTVLWTCPKLYSRHKLFPVRINTIVFGIHPKVEREARTRDWPLNTKRPVKMSRLQCSATPTVNLTIKKNIIYDSFGKSCVLIIGIIMIYIVFTFRSELAKSSLLPTTTIGTSAVCLVSMIWSLMAAACWNESGSVTE